MKPWLGEAEQAAAAEAVASGWVAQGPRVGAFEHAMAELVGAQHAVALSSCTAALHLALVVLGVGPGDDVVVPSLSFIATANAVRYVGARPVFADVDEQTQNLTVATIESALTPATRAVILVHQAGMPADVEEVHTLCDPRGVHVVEDAACAIGSTIGGALVGTGSDLVAFSFHPRKIITTGEGGMLMTARADLAERLGRLREHGMNVSASKRHELGRPMIEQYLETGFNYRMTDIQAAVGIVQLGRLGEIVERRRELAARYVEGLSDLPGLAFPSDPPFGTTNHQSFWTVLSNDAPVTRDELMAKLGERRIASRRGIMAAHLEPAYAGHVHGALPTTEWLTAHSIILPMFHEMTDDEHARVVTTIRDAMGAAR
ncbi:MAG: DegT/DnrJ/EryC1/StrS family aminotransferase [Acidimicrobiia bacterium]